MPKSFSKTPRRHHSPKVWAQAKAEYLAGVDSPEIEAKYGIRRNTFHKRAAREGWTRKAVWAAEAATVGASWSDGGDAAPSPELPTLDPVLIAETALREAMKALAAGRASEASALIKAGDAVGEFAEFVAAKRAGAG